MDSYFCKVVAEIQKDPFKLVKDPLNQTKNLTIRQFNQLREHLEVCQSCNDIVNEVLEKYKDVKRDNSGIDNTNLN
jgi:hypothetical protein